MSLAASARSILHDEFAYGRWLGLFKRRDQYIYRRRESSDWLWARDQSGRAVLDDDQIIAALEGRSRWIIGTASGAEVLWVTLDIDSCSQYHNEQSWVELRNLLESVGFCPQLYQSSSSGGWHIIIPLSAWTSTAKVLCLKHWLRSQGWKIKSGTLEFFPCGNGLRMPCQAGWGRVTDKGIKDLAGPTGVVEFLSMLRSAGRNWPDALANIVSLKPIKQEKSPPTTEHQNPISGGQEPLDRTIWERGRRYYLEGLPGRHHSNDAIYALGCYLWCGDPSNDVPSLAKLDERRADWIYAWFIGNHNGQCQDINTGRTDRLQQKIKNACSWRSDQNKKRSYDSPSLNEYRAKRGLTPMQMKGWNLKQENEARLRILAAKQTLQSQSKRVSIRAVAALAKSNRSTVSKVLKAQSPSGPPEYCGGKLLSDAHGTKDINTNSDLIKEAGSSPMGGIAGGTVGDLANIEAVDTGYCPYIRYVNLTLRAPPFTFSSA